jgi:hypothetical protein
VGGFIVNATTNTAGAAATTTNHKDLKFLGAAIPDYN